MTPVRADAVLIISHKRTEINSVKNLLEASGYCVFSCGDKETTINILYNNDISTVLINSGITSHSCDELLDSLLASAHRVPAILTDIMSISDSGMTIRAVKKDIFDFIISSYDPEQLLISAGRAIRHYDNIQIKSLRRKAQFSQPS